MTQNEIVGGTNNRERARQFDSCYRIDSFEHFIFLFIHLKSDTATESSTQSENMLIHVRKRGIHTICILNVII